MKKKKPWAIVQRNNKRIGSVIVKIVITWLGLEVKPGMWYARTKSP